MRKKKMKFQEWEIDKIPKRTPNYFAFCFRKYNQNIYPAFDLEWSLYLSISVAKHGTQRMASDERWLSKKLLSNYGWAVDAFLRALHCLFWHPMNGSVCVIQKMFVIYPRDSIHSFKTVINETRSKRNAHCFVMLLLFRRIFLWLFLKKIQRFINAIKIAVLVLVFLFIKASGSVLTLQFIHHFTVHIRLDIGIFDTISYIDRLLPLYCFNSLLKDYVLITYLDESIEFFSQYTYITRVYGWITDHSQALLSISWIIVQKMQIVGFFSVAIRHHWLQHREIRVFILNIYHSDIFKLIKYYAFWWQNKPHENK